MANLRYRALKTDKHSLISIHLMRMHTLDGTTLSGLSLKISLSIGSTGSRAMEIKRVTLMRLSCMEQKS